MGEQKKKWKEQWENQRNEKKTIMGRQKGTREQWEDQKEQKNNRRTKRMKKERKKQ